ncbi:MAG: phosphomannose isomerase type II C-terminal cupin domain [Candidatus Pacebacteria bacterium]|nr:phosphomannose isomerase type II C-terminal cupin domain [Candidatus Paceibacterota bacterium]
MDIYQEERPWGNFRQFIKNTPSTVKIITVHPGQALSLQTHEHRSEFWRVIDGVAKVEIGGEVFEAKNGDEFEIPTGTTHRVSVDESSTDNFKFLEIAIGDFNEADIHRLEDKYGRN